MITRRDIFGIACSATSKKGMARLKAKNDDERATPVVAAAKNDEKKEENAKETTT